MMIEFMKKALEVAKTSGEDIPVGCVIVKDGKIIAEGVNRKEALNDVTSHAEIEAIKKASEALNNWRLDGCEIYVTLEPCPMCAWAILSSRPKAIYFGARDIKYGGFTGAVNLQKFSDNDIKIFEGILEEECENLIREYFKERRC